MGCGALNRAQNIGETMKKARLVVLSSPRDEDPDLACNLEIDDFGHLQSNRRGKPLVPLQDTSEKHWLFQVEKHELGDNFSVSPWQGFYKVPQSFVASNRTVTDLSLKIEYICGAFIRNSTFFLRQAEIVYPAGIHCVIVNLSTGFQRVSACHDDEITAIAVHLLSSTMATGDKRHTVKVWNPTNFEIFSELKIDTKGVVSLSFSHNGEILVVLDSTCKITLWDWKFKKNVSSIVVSETVTCVHCHPEYLLIGLVGKKYVGFIRDKVLEKGVFGTHGKVCDMSCISMNSRFTYTGGSNGQVYLWTPPVLAKAYHVLEEGNPVQAIKATERNVVCAGYSKVVQLSVDMVIQKVCTIGNYLVKSLDFYADSWLIGTKEGKILMGNEDFQEVGWGFPEELLGLCICSESILAVLSPSKLDLFNYLSHRFRSGLNLSDVVTGNYPQGFTWKFSAVSYSPSRGQLVIGGTEGSLFFYTLQPALKPQKDLKFSNGKIDVISYCPNGNFLCYSSCKAIYIVDSFKFTLKSNSSEQTGNILTIDWGINNNCIQTCSDVYEIRHWDLEGKKIDAFEELWNGWSSPMGWPLHQISRSLLEISHITCVKASNFHNFIVLANDWGFLQLHSYPATAGIEAKAHAAHVKSLNWSPNDDKIISIGNKCLIIWELNN